MTNFSHRNTAVITLVTVALLFTPESASAQSSAEKTTTTWLDLGMRFPEGFPTNEISLFEGLNKARGTWTFEAETAPGDDDKRISLNGSLQVGGKPAAGMFPMWQMSWGWPADQPQSAINGIVIAAFRPDGFDLMFTRIGPVQLPADKNVRPKVLPTLFAGHWNPTTRTLTWTQKEPPTRSGKPADTDPSTPKQSFEMIVAADGRISVRNSKHMPPGQLLTATALVRTAAAPQQSSSLVGKHSFATVKEIEDQRIQPWLPPQATEIDLFSERNGHFARYKINEKDFTAFMNQLWETGGKDSAHKRESMSGEGEPVSRDAMDKRFKTLGWKPLENAVTWFSPSKGSGAMTTYYYDRKAGIAYHDRGYW